ncbi:alpha/beta fold hydrolase [Streptomyces sp. UNOC14_S4]|uniref:alpha/beta fold hydrolase n=1 Tax=Streptomyces sp. UNOC14_S4 TaxID=2872340 RepID=UPI001E3F96A9|nr:alpha/beta hydrolase [Streptomyces sp. UNOC14_S4]MCC3771291.1 alpha/beta hydrolase [Streptomyces sp. UNOC14_S4]
MPHSSAVDGFRLGYDLSGSGTPVVLLHGWPGDRTDYRGVVPLLEKTYQVVVPDLRGFGDSDKHTTRDVRQYGAAAQARSVVGLLDELGLASVVLAGYDIGSRIAQTVARDHPERVRALVVSPPLPGIGDRVLAPAAQQEFWYQAFHRLPLAERLLDGSPSAVRDHLAHFWSHWSGPEFALDEAALHHLVSVYGSPGAFTASIAWYRAGAGAVAVSLAEKPPAREDRIAVPTSVLWPEHDPLFPRAWSDRLGDFFTNVTVEFADGIGHFVPVEAPARFAEAIRMATTIS